MRLGRILLIPALLFTEAAMACSVKSPEGEAHDKAQLAALRHRYADEVVLGKWEDLQSPPDEEAAFVDGLVHVTDGNGEELYKVERNAAIGCSRYPADGERGVFFLRADLDLWDIEDGFSRERIEYDLLGFMPLSEGEPTE